MRGAGGGISFRSNVSFMLAIQSRDILHVDQSQETKTAELMRWCDAASLIHSSLSLSHFLIISRISLIFTFDSLLYIARMCTHIPTSRNSLTDTLPHVIRIREQCDYCRSHVATDVGSGGAEGAAAPTTARRYTSSLWERSFGFCLVFFVFFQIFAEVCGANKSLISLILVD